MKCDGLVPRVTLHSIACEAKSYGRPFKTKSERFLKYSRPTSPTVLHFDIRPTTGNPSSGRQSPPISRTAQKISKVPVYLLFPRSLQNRFTNLCVSNEIVCREYQVCCKIFPTSTVRPPTSNWTVVLVNPP